MTQFNNCKLAFYQNNGAASNDLQDAQREWLILEGFPPQHNADMFFEYLRANGYVGDRSDMQAQFWRDQDCTA